jgi:hypothetical protein
MAIFQTGTGYRDSSKAMTIKALQERQKSAREALANANQTADPMISPWQGAAQLGNVLASGIASNRAAADEGAARGRLAEIMAGIDPEKGATMQQIAEMQTLDPDFANKTYADMMAERAASRKQEDQQSFLAGESAADRQARIAEQDALFGHQDKTASTLAGTQEAAAVADDTRTAAQKIEDDKRAVEEQKRQETAASEEAQRKEAADVDVGPEVEARKAEWLKLNPTGDPDSPEAQAYILRNAAPATDPLGGRAAQKDITDLKLQASHFDSALDNINQAKSLVGNVITGSGNLALIKGALSLPVGSEAALNALMSAKGWTREQVDATTQFDRVMGGETVKFMSSTLKGQSSNYEMAKFTSIMNDPNATPQQRMQALTDMERAITRDRSVLSNSLAANYGADPLPDYVYYSTAATAPPATDAAAPAAPAAATTEGETPEQKEQRLRKLLSPQGG